MLHWSVSRRMDVLAIDAPDKRQRQLLPFERNTKICRQMENISRQFMTKRRQLIDVSHDPIKANKEDAALLKIDDQVHGWLGENGPEGQTDSRPTTRGA